MPSAIILLNTDVGTEKDVLKHLRSHECVEEAYAVHSVYDIVAKVKAESFGKLQEIIVGIKRSLPKTHSVITMLIVDSAVGTK